MEVSQRGAAFKELPPLSLDSKHASTKTFDHKFRYQTVDFYYPIGWWLCYSDLEKVTSTGRPC